MACTCVRQCSVGGTHCGRSRVRLKLGCNRLWTCLLEPNRLTPRGLVCKEVNTLVGFLLIVIGKSNWQEYSNEGDST